MSDLTVGDLRKHLWDTMQSLKRGEISAQDASTQAKLVDSMIRTVQTEMRWQGMVEASKRKGSELGAPDGRTVLAGEVETDEPPAIEAPENEEGNGATKKRNGKLSGVPDEVIEAASRDIAQGMAVRRVASRHGITLQQVGEIIDMEPA